MERLSFMETRRELMMDRLGYPGGSTEGFEWQRARYIKTHRPIERVFHNEIKEIPFNPRQHLKAEFNTIMTRTYNGEIKPLYPFKTFDDFIEMQPTWVKKSLGY